MPARRYGHCVRGWRRTFLGMRKPTTLSGRGRQSWGMWFREEGRHPRLKSKFLARNDKFMETVVKPETHAKQRVVPRTMQAAVYHGKDDVRLETLPVPEIGAGELLVRIHTCGICGTDLKKIATGSHSAPRIFGHEMAGQVVAAGAGVRDFAIDDRVMVFHHIPCGKCYYCRKKVFAQCPVYKKVGATAGFEPSGGGFARNIRGRSE